MRQAAQKISGLPTKAASPTERADAEHQQECHEQAECRGGLDP